MRSRGDILDAGAANFSSTDPKYIQDVLWNTPYNYCAQTTPAIALTVLFGLATIGLAVQASLRHKWKLCWPIIMAGIWETLSFGMRAQTALNQFTAGPLVTPSVLLVLLAPLWINAFDYIVFGRMVYYFLPGGRIGWVRAERMSVIFVWLDVSAFIVQLVGGLMANQTGQAVTNTVRIGLHIYTAGIALQQAFLLCFCALIAVFHSKMAKGLGRVDRSGWKTIIFPLYATMALITMRIIYRMIEYSQNGGDKALTNHEWPLYVLDATPMIICLIIWNIWHPGNILVGPESEFGPSPPGWFRRLCCCCCAGNRRKSWERKHGMTVQEWKRQRNADEDLQEVKGMGDYVTVQDQGDLSRLTVGSKMEMGRLREGSRSPVPEAHYRDTAYER